MRTARHHTPYWPRFHAYMPTDIAIATGAGEALTISTVVYETVPGIVPDVGDPFFFFPVKGLWQFSVGVHWHGLNSATMRYLSLVGSAGDYPLVQSRGLSSTSQQVMVGSAVIDIPDEGSYLSVIAAQSSGSTLSVFGSAYTFFSGIYLGAS